MEIIGMRFYSIVQIAAELIFQNIQEANGKEKREVALCNLALHRQTYSSVEFNGTTMGHSCNAVDDGTSKNYSVGTCFKSSPAFPGLPLWRVDLEKAYAIVEIKIFLREDDYELSKEEFRDVKIFVDSTSCYNFTGPPSKFETMMPLLIMSCAVTGRFLRIERQSPGPLTLCEVQVYATDITMDKPCSDPSQLWYCRDLHYGYTPKPTTYESVEKETTTEPQLPVTDSCKSTCTCATSGSQQVTNSSMIDIMAQLEEIINEIEVDKKETSLAKSKRICAVNNRTSARVTGFVGVLFLSIVFGSFVLFDLINYLS